MSGKMLQVYGTRHRRSNSTAHWRHDCACFRNPVHHEAAALRLGLAIFLCRGRPRSVADLRPSHAGVRSADTVARSLLTFAVAPGTPGYRQQQCNARHILSHTALATRHPTQPPGVLHMLGGTDVNYLSQGPPSCPEPSQGLASHNRDHTRCAWPSTPNTVGFVCWPC